MKLYSINVKYIYSPGHACGWLEMTFMSFEILLTFVILCSIKQAGRTPSAARWSSWKIFFGAVVWKMLLCIICIVNNPGYLKYLGKQERVWQTDGGTVCHLGTPETHLWNSLIWVSFRLSHEKTQHSHCCGFAEAATPSSLIFSQ